MEWEDGKTRCRWANPKNERYIRYHDEEWGVPVYDDHKLFEMLILESFQAGLSWECVLNKQEAFREAFDGFDLEKVCAYTEQDFERLQENPGIIRNKRKIRAAAANAKVFREIRQETAESSADWLDVALDGGEGHLRKKARILRAFGPGVKGPKKAGDDLCRDNDHLCVPAGRWSDLLP